MCIHCLHFAQYWDLKSPNPVATIDLPERAYAMDISRDLLVVATADNPNHSKMVYFKLNNPGAPAGTDICPLRLQPKAIAVFPEANGYAIAGVEGRTGIQ